MSSIISLSSTALKTISKNIKIPLYKRTNIVPSIVHFGVGNFCRSHLFENTHHVNNQLDRHMSDEKPWLIHGIGVLDNKFERNAWEKLQSNDFLYGLLTLPSNKCEIIGSLCSYDWIPHSNSTLISAINSISRPETKIITLTITEKGYCMDIEGNLDFKNPDVKHDLTLLTTNKENKTTATNNNNNIATLSSSYKTSLGLLIEGLIQRKANESAGPVTILSCDNLPSNGNFLKSILLEFILKTDNDELLAYVEENISFPNSMVDRITPGVTDETVSMFEKQTNVADPLPVIAEDFTQWVVEDNFLAGRPSWEDIEDNNILFVDDCEPYECMKLRLLNASHSAMAYLSILAGHTKVDEALTNDNVYQYVKSYMDMATSTVPDVPGIDVEEYKKILRFRFSNLSDDLSRLAQDGSKKMIGFILPSLEIKLQNNESTEQIASVIASWICYLNEMDENDIDDPRKNELIDLSRKIMSDSSTIKEFIHSTLGDHISKEEQFLQQIKKYLNIIENDGVEKGILDQHEFFKSKV